MITYTLKCADEHQFDSWFQSAEAFDKLKTAGMVVCAVCGSGKVEKALMAPRVRPARKASGHLPAAPEPAPSRPLSAPANPAEQALAALKKKIEANSDYVGLNFASEARAIHDGTAPERAIYGEARADEAKKLIEDGIPVAPLPFLPGRKSN
ncbi:DUF1178 family protein [Lacimonas salitolerans]|uniref:DUF1178 family protein n=1 Tax=Lacimonas salitolerans TaxID=1323750 RepID=A0ABW4EKQ8_9RHOB